MKDLPIENDRVPVGPPSLWQENHGNLLLAFLVMIFLVGASILAYRQNRFRPPRFPSSQSIANPLPEVALAESNAVTVVVSGAASDDGAMMIALYDSAEDFNDPDRATMVRSVGVREGSASWTIAADSLPLKIAVAAFHDENQDGVLNRNRVGIPTERYGFSRNARGLIGPPGFEQAVIDRPGSGEEIAVFVR